jgi:hypothetical protein
VKHKDMSQFIVAARRLRNPGPNEVTSQFTVVLSRPKQFGHFVFINCELAKFVHVTCMHDVVSMAIYGE